MVRVGPVLYWKYDMKVYEYLFIKKRIYEADGIHFGQDCRWMRSSFSAFNKREKIIKFGFLSKLVQ